MALSGRTVERLSVYRRLLVMQGQSGEESVYSHQLAEMVSGTAAQVRRDLMEVGVTGHSKRGYRVANLIEGISKVLDDPAGTRIVLVGAGDLGRAALGFIKGRNAALRIVGAFDNDPSKIGRVIHGYRCASIDELERVIAAEQVEVAIITTPAGVAQPVCDRLVAAGVRGIVNFAPTPLQVPEGVWVERVDIATALEKVTCLTRSV
ncbi:MAG: redox-sensing transcriptional repressor Rex [Verrucomicrobia bacterium]|nr:redox-sensing transcriptional repressor Rex [Verrucomicrobiota bacterium]MBT7067645.1 redox-sensing transcriptional repressor Rex [Verrucomicrobiota bacterium]MBT7701400.1 redox-sensing transcriptional repressor Rex [Verrucomicrobiota bacterium]